MDFNEEFITYEQIIEMLKDIKTLSEKIALIKKVKDHNNNLINKEIKLGEELRKIDRLKTKKDDIEQEISITKPNIIKMEKQIEENIEKSIDRKEIDPSFKLLLECKTEEEIINVLSKITKKEIIIKILLKFKEELVLFDNMKNDKTENYSEEDIAYLDEKIEIIEEQFEIIKNFLNPIKEDKTHVTKEKPILIYLKTNSNNTCALSDAKDVPREYKENFNNLFKSILEGKFKNHKFLSNNSGFVSGLQEVKDFKIRIIYKNISSNTYVIMGMFMKKDQNDKGSSEFMKQRSALYVQKERELLRIINNPELLANESSITEEITNILGNIEKGENTNGRIIK